MTKLIYFITLLTHHWITAERKEGSRKKEGNGSEERKDVNRRRRWGKLMESKETKWLRRWKDVIQEGTPGLHNVISLLYLQLSCFNSCLPFLVIPASGFNLRWDYKSSFNKKPALPSTLGRLDASCCSFPGNPECLTRFSENEDVGFVLLQTDSQTSQFLVGIPAEHEENVKEIKQRDWAINSRTLTMTSRGGRSEDRMQELMCWRSGVNR